MDRTKAPETEDFSEAQLLFFMSRRRTCSQTVLSLQLRGALPFSHDTVMQILLLLDVGMIPAGPLAAFAVVTAENWSQFLLGHPVGWKRDGAFLCQAPAVLQITHQEEV